MQSIWRVFEYLTQTVHPYMNATDQCLYNAVVRTMADQSDAYLDQVRTAALDLANGIAAELADRQADREASALELEEEAV